MRKDLTPREIDRIIEMGWEDRTPFDAITLQFGLKEQEVITLMRRNMKPSSFKLWRKRVQGEKPNILKSDRQMWIDSNVAVKKGLATIKFLNVEKNCVL